jgi:hypothetical protein
MIDHGFKFWLEMSTMIDAGTNSISGAEVVQNHVMKAAMYIAYRAAYDEIAKKDHEEAILAAQDNGKNPNEVTFQPAWSLNDWLYDGSRAAKWTYLGNLPSEADLASVKKGLEEYKNNIQALADSGKVSMPSVGGITYRDKGDGIKLTGAFGSNAKAKGAALVKLNQLADQENKSIFTGADSQLVDMLDRSREVLAKLHKRAGGNANVPTVTLERPPVDIVPFLYQIISKSPEFSGGGSWSGHNPDGSLNFDLNGVGMRKKFLLGNKVFWKNQISKILSNAGVGPDKIAQLRMSMNLGPFAGIGVSMVNKALNKQGYATNLSADSIRWILKQLD